MRKDEFKEENKEYFVPEYYSFESEEFSLQNETFRHNKETYNKVKEDNKIGDEDNKIKQAPKPESNKFENISKNTTRTSTAIRTVIVTGSSVAIVIGGVMIYNETVLPPSHVEIIESYAYENNIGFMVYASNYDQEEMEYHEEAFGEECDLQIELYGDGQLFSFHMQEMGYFYEEFTDLKYDTEYELTVYQNISLGVDRPVLASTKIRTEPEGSVKYDPPSVSEITFEKYTNPDDEEVAISFSFQVSDENNFYSNYEFNLFEMGMDEPVGESFLELGEETWQYFGSYIISSMIGDSFTYTLTALSNYPDDLIDGEPSRITIRSGDLNLLDLTELNDNLDESSKFFGISFLKYSYPDGSSETVYYLNFEDPEKYWISMYVEITLNEDVFTSYASDSLTDEQYLDMPEIEGSALVRVYAYSTNPKDLHDAEMEAEVLIHEETYDFSNIPTEFREKKSEFYSAIFSKEEGDTVESQTQILLGVRLYYSDDAGYWSEFTINISKDDESKYYGTLEAIQDELQVLNGFNITYLSGVYHITIECHSDDPNDSDGTSGFKVLYDEDVDFDSL